jgi:transposase
MVQIVLNEVEMDRLCVLRQVKDRQLTQEEAGQRVGLSSRQIRRLLKRVKSHGSQGIKFHKMGGNRAFSEDFKTQIMKEVKTNYADFGPTFAAEKLQEHQGLAINRETLRQWMIEAGLWKGRSRKAARIHQSRERRPRFGELIQIDGSHHDWFEGRAPQCCLLVFIDDATSKIVALRFEPSETTMGYFRCLKDHLQTYGRPLAYYSDKHSIFKTTRQECVDGRLSDTQVQRALRDLQIELICAHSSQAKGRVERANKTLQDRLIKEMRLHQISTLEEANAYLPSFLKQYNERFVVLAKKAVDAHRPLHHSSEALNAILSIQSTRKLTKNLEFSHHCNLYQIQRPGGGYHLRHATVTVCEHTDGTIEVLHKEKALIYKVQPRPTKQPHVVDTKEINSLLDQIVSLITSKAGARYPQGPQPLPSLAFDRCWEGYELVDNASSKPDSSKLHI